MRERTIQPAQANGTPPRWSPPHRRPPALADDGTWERARGLALHQAALIIPYYAETNPPFAAPAKRTVEEILADLHA
jgi:hypothetical protein